MIDHVCTAPALCLLDNWYMALQQGSTTARLVPHVLPSAVLLLYSLVHAGLNTQRRPQHSKVAVSGLQHLETIWRSVLM